MIGNPNSEEARDSYASWQLAIAVLREKGVRSGLYAPRADHPDEVRWAAEGPRPPEQLDVCAYTPPTLEQRLDAAAEEYRNETYVNSADDAEWAELHEEVKDGYREIVRGVCRAFAPEHFNTDTTTGKD